MMMVMMDDVDDVGDDVEVDVDDDGHGDGGNNGDGHGDGGDICWRTLTMMVVMMNVMTMTLCW